MPRDVTHTVSPGLWALAWRRLRADKVAMVSLAIVIVFLVMIVLSGTGLIAKDWSNEVGVNYAPPSFLGATEPAATQSAEATQSKASDKPTELPVADPRADALAAIRGETPKATGESAAGEGSTVDPLADIMAEIRGKAVEKKPVEARRPTLPLGGDKWGRDVLKKVIKGSETSIFVGLAAAAVATFLGTLFGAVAGYYGKWLDDFFNWFYSVFTAIPYLLLILAVAAVLQQKGTL